MKVKGSSVIVLPEFVKTFFGEEGYARWLSNLADDSKQIFQAIILPSAWYDVDSALINPTEKLAEIFYANNVDTCCLEIGKFSAEYSFKGFLGFLIKMGSPEFTMKKADRILGSIYTPSKMEVVSVEKGKAVLRVVEFGKMHKVIEVRMKAFIERATGFAGGNNVSVMTAKSLTSGDPYTEFVIKWD